jgi:hypothetical protein
MIRIAPPNPTSSDNVVIVPQFQGCVNGSGIVQSGFTFTGHIDYAGSCFATPPGGDFPFPVGRLAPGNYTVTIQGAWDTNTAFAIETVTFSVVQSSSIPAIGWLGLALISMLILATARRLFRR